LGDLINLGKILSFLLLLLIHSMLEIPVYNENYLVSRQKRIINPMAKPRNMPIEVVNSIYNRLCSFRCNFEQLICIIIWIWYDKFVSFINKIKKILKKNIYYHIYQFVNMIAKPLYLSSSAKPIGSNSTEFLSIFKHYKFLLLHKLFIMVIKIMKSSIQIIFYLIYQN